MKMSIDQKPFENQGSITQICLAFKIIISLHTNGVKNTLNDPFGTYKQLHQDLTAT